MEGATVTDDLEQIGTQWGVQRPDPYMGVITDPCMTRGEAERSAAALEARYGKTWTIVSRRQYVSQWESA